MALSLAGRTVIVTGGGRGIGREVALLAGRLGANVIVNDPGVNLDGSGSDEGPASEVVNEIQAAGGQAAANLDSVAESAGGENIVRQAIDTYGSVDGVIHVAGILRDRMVFNMTEQEFDDVVAVHLTGFFNVAQPASIVMRQQRFGRIVGFSSGAGLGGNTGQANYAAAKAGIVGMVRCLARDLGRYGVTANAIAPVAGTRMTAQSDAAHSQRGADRSRAEGSVQAMRDPKYVAPMTTYLMSDQAWNINGKVFNVAGGQVGLSAEEQPLRSLAKNGTWTIDELAALVPSTLMQGLANPAPPAADIDVPGRSAAMSR